MSTTEVCPEKYLSPADIARTLGNHPSAAVRWMRRGVLLAAGSRLFLRYVALPGGYRVKQEWLDEFLESLTLDRQRGDERTDGPALIPKRHSDRVERMNRALDAQGL
jgi:hypothetical protein